MKSMFALFLMFVLAFSFAPAMADTAAAPDAAPAVEAPAAPEFTGKVEEKAKDEAGKVIAVVLVVGEEKYDLVGEGVLEMVGKTVKVTGAVEEKEGVKVLTVATIAEVVEEPKAEEPKEESAE